MVWLGLILILCLLTFLGTLEAYREHLLYDVSVYYARSLYFFEYSKLTGVMNEYLPVSIIYFILFSPVFFLSNTIEYFERAFGIGNALLWSMLAWIIFKEKGSKAVMIYSFLLLSAGPLILYRFEVLVILAMILSLLRFQKNDHAGSAIFLGLGTMTKLFPVLLLPYFLILSYRQKGLKGSLKYAGIFGLSTAFVAWLYFFFTQTGINEFSASLGFHKDKPLGLESPLGALNQLVYYLQNGTGAPIVARHNTWGVDDAYLLLPMPILVYLWVIPVSFWYLRLWFSKTKQAQFLFVIGFLTAFFVFSKLFTPQYWLWILFLLPFLDFRKKAVIAMTIFAGLAAVLTQIIYPLNYFDFLYFFYNQNKEYEYLFWIYLIEIGFIVITAGIANKLLFKEMTKL